jgi:PHD/YefM family antitoxin component YafN of YafNO toxin-antitoxin module
MVPKLTAEQREALRQGKGPIAVEDEQNHQVYFIVDKSTLDLLQKEQDVAAIREGLADVEAGRVTPIGDSMARIRQQLGLPQRTR